MVDDKRLYPCHFGARLCLLVLCVISLVTPGASTCNCNGMVDDDETGVDCGTMHACGACPASYCGAGCNNNGMVDNGETEVDCGGGGCPACAGGAVACNSNGMVDNGESGVDCGGGGCGACPPCNCNGILDDGETDVDCGTTVCGACPASTCGPGEYCNNNGMVDNGETEVDCGGGGCPACGEEAPLCNCNGVMDNGETDVDCGDPCDCPTSCKYDGTDPGAISLSTKGTLTCSPGEVSRFIFDDKCGPNDDLPMCTPERYKTMACTQITTSEKCELAAAAFNFAWSNEILGDGNRNTCVYKCAIGYGSGDPATDDKSVYLTCYDTKSGAAGAAATETLHHKGVICDDTCKPCPVNTFAKDNLCIPCPKDKPTTRGKGGQAQCFACVAGNEFFTNGLCRCPFSFVQNEMRTQCIMSAGLITLINLFVVGIIVGVSIKLCCKKKFSNSYKKNFDKVDGKYYLTIPLLIALIGSYDVFGDVFFLWPQTIWSPYPQILLISIFTKESLKMLALISTLFVSTFRKPDVSFYFSF